MISRAPTLGVGRILAFGDSITEGEVREIGEFSFQPHFVEPDMSYPAYLTAMLAQRYPTQGAQRVDAFAASRFGGPTNCAINPPDLSTSSIVVINAGCLGEAPSDPATQQRLDSKIAAYRPDLVLILEGTNDPSAAGVQGVVSLVHDVRNRGLAVVVGTIPPEVGREPDPATSFNAQLAPAVTAAGARVVDLNSDIAANVADWISLYDGVHPTVAGYQEIARVWFQDIQRAYEIHPLEHAGSHPSSVR